MMKWGTLLKDLKDKVGAAELIAVSDPTTPPSSSSAASPSSSYAASAQHDFNLLSPTSRDKLKLELDFKRFWEEFRSSSSEQEKEAALNLSVNTFCRLVKQHANVDQLVTMLVEPHIFSFVIGRAFVADVEKLKICSKTRSLDVDKLIKFFSEVTEEGLSHGANLLTAIEVLASGPFDKQSLLDSGILCCLIHTLNAFLTYSVATEGEKTEKVEGSVVHIMKALASHPSAAQSLIEDDSLQLLFNMVANGSLMAFSRYKEGLVSSHNIQLHIHAMQILRLLLVNDNGSTASYIRKHHLIKALLMVVKEFDPDCGDSAYTMGIVDLLLECVELSYRPETGGVRLKEDIRNAHGYHFLVQFALILSSMPKDIVFAFNHSSPPKNSGSDDSEKQPPLSLNSRQNDEFASKNFSPSLSRLLDVLVTLAQTGPIESSGTSTSLLSHAKPTGYRRSQTPSGNNQYDDAWEQGSGKVKDLEAVQMLQDIFLKAENKDLQAEVLNRMFKIFTSHLENYRMCQELRTVPLLVLNMGGFPSSLQELILKILEYAVTVVNCVPEQELLSLCFLLQQPINSELKHTILSFFVKLTSFDQQYKKVLGEVGVLEVLQDDLKQHKLLRGPDQYSGVSNHLDRVPSSPSFKQHLDNKDAIISSPKLMESGSGNLPIFEVERTITVGWDCMISLLKKSEANQEAFRSANGVTIILPFLMSDEHRTSVLRILSLLITEDIKQVHHEELEAVIDVLKSGMVTRVSGHQYKLHYEARCDIMGALWRIIGVNGSAQRVFGEATGFSLLVTTLHTFQGEEECRDESHLMVYIKLFKHLLRLMTTAVCENAINRMKLHSVIISQTFYDLLVESGLLCVDLERQVIQLLLELALEILLPPFLTSESMASAETAESEKASFLVNTPSGQFNPDKQKIYNAGAVRVVIRSLLLFTPKMQLEFLNLLERLARASPFNQENLTSAGCVELLLEIIHPFLPGSSPFLSHALKIVEVLGAYRLSPSELKMLCRYVMQMRVMNSGPSLVGMMEKLILMEDTGLEHVSLAPFVEMDMSKTGHASVQVSLGERSWPPAAGYSFVCWFQFRNFLTTQGKESEVYKAGGSSKTPILSGQQSDQNVFRIFSVNAISNESPSYAELYFQEDGILTLATSNSNSLSFSGLETEEGKWHHLAVVHSKPSALAGLFQASVAYVYIDGKLRHMGKLGYSPSPVGKSLQVIVGTPATCARVSNLTWKLRSCYLFEEVLTSGCIGFMYILGRGYTGLFQDAYLLRFVPNQACGGGSMAILDLLDTDMSSSSSIQKFDDSNRQGDFKAHGSGIVWDLERLGNLSIKLPGKKLIFAFDGTCSEFMRATGSFSLLNLVDPLSAAASLIGGIPRFGCLVGNVSICRQNVIGNSIRPVGGMAVVLALVEAAESRDMLHMALSLLACALHQNSQNVKDMETYRGYHLLALFLRPKMTLFDMQCLEIFFQISACEAFFSEPKKLESGQSTISMSPTEIIPENNYEDPSLSKFQYETSSVGSHGDMDDFSGPKDSFSHLSELEMGDSVETSNCIVLSDADMVEHVLLDWTLWVTAPVSIQIALLGFLENLISMLWYRSHNLTILRQINLVKHLLVTLQRGDVEVLVLEKLVILLGCILEDMFLTSELEDVVRFVIMTFNPPEIKSRNSSMRESMGKHVIVRNLVLEMLIDLQVTIKAEELLEQWHKIVSSKLITYFLDGAVHPSSMRWIMTLLGVCLTSSPNFSLKFFASGGYQGLIRVLQSFYDSPDIYYILFCLIFGKPVYPRLPEVRMLDFHALMPDDGSHVELKFVDLLDSVVAMAKSTFDRLIMQSMLAHQSGNLSQVSASLVEGNTDMTGELQGEALMHKTYAARLMGGEASAPATATSVIRFMVDLAKMCPQFSAACRSTEFLQKCADLYFSCVRASHAVKMAKQLSMKAEEQNISGGDDSSAEGTFCRLRHQDQSTKTSISAGSFPQEQASVSSEDMSFPSDYVSVDKVENILTTPPGESNKSFQGREYVMKEDGDHVGPVSVSSERKSLDLTGSSSQVQPIDSQSSESFSMLESPLLSEKSSLEVPFIPSPSPAVSWLGSNYIESKSSTISTPHPSHISVSEFDASSDQSSGSQGSSAAHTLFKISPKVLLETDESGYGGGPCSAGASAVLDFMAEVCADIMTDQIKAVQALESILEMLPLYVDPECVLVFQGLCLSRVMNYLERRFLRDDEEDDKKLDKRKWSANLDAFCWMIVDRVYMGAFPQPTGVLRTLEFLLSILQLANKDGRVEEVTSSGKGLLSIGRATRQLDAYVHSILKNTNRTILYCFLPSFLITIGEEDLPSRLGLLAESTKKQTSKLSVEESGIDISAVLQLLVANKNIILCPSNLDTDLNCCLCVNLISLLHDQRKNVQNMASNIIKYLLVHRKSALEDLLVKKPHRGQKFDVLHGGFDRLLTGNLPEFSKWLKSSEQIISKVLEQGAAVMWIQYMAGSAKFPDVRMKGMDGRRTREMGRKSRDTSKLDLKHWEQVNEQRYALEVVRDAMSAELRVVRQNKYGLILHAESVWQSHLQHLVHERGIFPLRISRGTEDHKWQLCPIEGPYRMRKKLERCKLKIDSIHNLLEGKLELREIELLKSENEDVLVISDMDSEPAFLLSELYSESFSEEADDLKDVRSARNGWNSDRSSSKNEASLHNALSFGGKSSTTAASVPISDNTDEKSETGSPIKSSSSGKMDEIRAVEEESEKELNDNGAYLIRPYLEHLEKIRFRYNCERVVGLDKHDGIFLIGELCLYVIENFYIDDHGCICEKECEDELSVIDQALGVKKQFTGSLESQSKSSTLWSTTIKIGAVGGRAWAYGGGAWGKEKVRVTGNLPHPWRMWKLDSVHEILKRDYELRPVAVEIFSMDGCNDLLVFHKKEREEVFRNLLAMNLPRNSMLDTTISGSAKQESKEGSRIFKLMAKSFTKRWQNGEISNFQYLMHLNTLAGRGYSDLTQYPVFPWILADYDSESLDLSDPNNFRKLDKPMGCQTPEGEEEFSKRYESWDDPEVPKFHYGSHYSSAGIVLFYLIRLAPFSAENQKLQGGQFDHADRLFNSIRETWLSAAGKGNTSDVKELIPEFFYMPEFLENRFNLDLGEKQSGEKVSDVVLPPWARGSVREFIRKHREALESDYVSENLHHWIDLIFGHKQRGKAAENAVNVFYHYTYEGNVDVDAVTDPAMKASILAQINHFGQTPKQLFQKPHVKRRTDRKFPPHPLKHSMHLVPRDIRKCSSSVNQIITFNDKLLVAGSNCFLKPRGYKKYIRWGFPDRTLRFMSYDQDKLLSTHENLHEGNQIQCAGVSHDGRIVVTGADDGLVSVWRVSKDGPRGSRRLQLEKSLCAHTAKVTCLRVSQPYMMIASSSDDCTVIIWDLSSLNFVRQLPNFPVPVSAVYINDLTGEIVTAAGSVLAVWSINGDCLAVVNTSQLLSDLIVSVAGSTFSDWLETTWYVTGHQSGAVKVWRMVHCTDPVSAGSKTPSNRTEGLNLGNQKPEYKLLLHKELKFHKQAVTALHLTTDLKQLLSGDSAGHLLSWTVPEEILKASLRKVS